MNRILLIVILFTFSLNVAALTPEAESGKVMMDICNICHEDNLDPPKAPPFYDVQNYYKKTTSDKVVFITKMTEFMRKPSRETALMKEAVKHLGPHPKLGFPDADMKKIASYIFENTFEPPCKHWQAGMMSAKKSNDMKHYEKDKKKFEMHCLKK